MNYILWVTTFIFLVISFAKSKEKTKSALLIAYRKFKKMAFLFLFVMAGFALIIVFVSPQVISKYIGINSGISGILIALGFGSISVMPGFAAFPLCAVLREQGIPFYIIASFSLSLMNIGIVTFPLEKKFLGTSVAIIRNIIALIVTVITIVIVKIIFYE